MPSTIKRTCCSCGKIFYCSPYGGGVAYMNGGLRPCCLECIRKYKLKTYV